MRLLVHVTTSLCVLACLVLAAPVAAQTGPSNLVLSFDRLAVLDEGTEGHYEGWAIVGGSPISTGKFNVNASGQPVGLGGGSVIAEFDAGQDIMLATDIKISIEPPGDVDTIPSGLIIVDGIVSGAMTPLKAAVPGLATLETMTAGSFILATPSDNSVDMTNDDQGIWFLSMPGPMPGFTNLPDIGPNWVYEGWVVDTSGPNPVPYSTGTFSMAAAADANAGGCNGGGPPFPGEDFTAFHCGPVLDLDSGDFAAVISIEPVPDNGAAPFQLKPMAGGIPTDALTAGNNPVANQVQSTFPEGLALLFGVVPTEDTTWGALKGSFE